MLTVIDQSQTNQYRIRYFYLNEDKEHECYHMIGFDDDTHELVNLGDYKYYKQAIDVFASMDYQDNDLIYYKKNNKLFYMPENITDEQECLLIFGSLY